MEEQRWGRPDLLGPYRTVWVRSVQVLLQAEVVRSILNRFLAPLPLLKHLLRAFLDLRFLMQ